MTSGRDSKRIFRKEWNFRSPGGTAVALMSSGIKTATGLLWSKHWTTGKKRTIPDIILVMLNEINSFIGRTIGIELQMTVAVVV
jgi:hypothetical protein